jgi:hypothetical protein
MEMSRTTKRDLDNVARYLALRGAGVPRWVTGHEAYRMTLGRVGTWGQTGGEGFSLAALCKTGEVHPLSDPRVESFTQAQAPPGVTS